MKHLHSYFLLVVLVQLSFGQILPARSPNIVFIVADDLGYGDLGCYGQEKIKTPHIDRMAKEGMKFTAHYAGNAVCAPSRSVLMTGKNPGHTYIRNNRGMGTGHVVGKPEVEGQFPIPDDEVTLAEVMQDAGYVTGGFGKWGLGGPDSTGEPLRQGFDRWFGYNCQAVAHNFYPTYLWDDNNFSSLDPWGADDDIGYEKYLEDWKPNAKGREYSWLLNACRAATTVVMNMDYSSNQLKVWSGYILTMSKTWFINSNQDDASSFGVLNRNIFAGMHELFPKIKKLKDSR